jgi:hypothetical protein
MHVEGVVLEAVGGQRVQLPAEHALRRLGHKLRGEGVGQAGFPRKLWAFGSCCEQAAQCWRRGEGAQKAGGGSDESTQPEHWARCACKISAGLKTKSKKPTDRSAFLECTVCIDRSMARATCEGQVEEEEEEEEEEEQQQQQQQQFLVTTK